MAIPNGTNTPLTIEQRYGKKQAQSIGLQNQRYQQGASSSVLGVLPGNNQTIAQQLQTANAKFGSGLAHQEGNRNANYISTPASSPSIPQSFLTGKADTSKTTPAGGKSGLSTYQAQPISKKTTTQPDKNAIIKTQEGWKKSTTQPNTSKSQPNLTISGIPDTTKSIGVVTQIGSNLTNSSDNYRPGSFSPQMIMAAKEMSKDTKDKSGLTQLIGSAYLAANDFSKKYEAGLTSALGTPKNFGEKLLHSALSTPVFYSRLTTSAAMGGWAQAKTIAQDMKNSKSALDLIKSAQTNMNRLGESAVYSGTNLVNSAANDPEQFAADLIAGFITGGIATGVTKGVVKGATSSAVKSAVKSTTHGVKSALGTTGKTISNAAKSTTEGLKSAKTTIATKSAANQARKQYSSGKSKQIAPSIADTKKTPSFNKSSQYSKSINRNKSNTTTNTKRNVFEISSKSTVTNPTFDSVQRVYTVKSLESRTGITKSAAAFTAKQPGYVQNAIINSWKNGNNISLSQAQRIAKETKQSIRLLESGKPESRNVMRMTSNELLNSFGFNKTSEEWKFIKSIAKDYITVEDAHKLIKSYNAITKEIENEGKRLSVSAALNKYKEIISSDIKRLPAGSSDSKNVLKMTSTELIDTFGFNKTAEEWIYLKDISYGRKYLSVEDARKFLKKYQDRDTITVRQTTNVNPKQSKTDSSKNVLKMTSNELLDLFGFNKTAEEWIYLKDISYGRKYLSVEDAKKFLKKYQDRDTITVKQTSNINPKQQKTESSKNVLKMTSNELLDTFGFNKTAEEWIYIKDIYGKEKFLSVEDAKKLINRYYENKKTYKQITIEPKPEQPKNVLKMTSNELVDAIGYNKSSPEWAFIQKCWSKRTSSLTVTEARRLVKIYSILSKHYKYSSKKLLVRKTYEKYIELLSSSKQLPSGGIRKALTSGDNIQPAYKYKSTYKKEPTLSDSEIEARNREIERKLEEAEKEAEIRRKSETVKKQTNTNKSDNILDTSGLTVREKSVILKMSQGKRLTSSEQKIADKIKITNVKSKSNTKSKENPNRVHKSSKSSSSSKSGYESHTKSSKSNNTNKSGVSPKSNNNHTVESGVEIKLNNGMSMLQKVKSVQKTQKPSQTTAKPSSSQQKQTQTKTDAEILAEKLKTNSKSKEKSQNNKQKTQSKKETKSQSTVSVSIQSKKTNSKTTTANTQKKTSNSKSGNKIIIVPPITVNTDNKTKSIPASKIFVSIPENVLSSTPGLNEETETQTQNAYVDAFQNAIEEINTHNNTQTPNHTQTITTNATINYATSYAENYATAFAESYAESRSQKKDTKTARKIAIAYATTYAAKVTRKTNTSVKIKEGTKSKTKTIPVPKPTKRTKPKVKSLKTSPIPRKKTVKKTKTTKRTYYQRINWDNGEFPWLMKNLPMMRIPAKH